MDGDSPPKYKFDYPRHVSGGILGLTGSNAQRLGSSVLWPSQHITDAESVLILTCEARCHKYAGETTEPAYKRGARNVPVLAADVFVSLVAPSVDNDTEDDEYDYSDDFEGCKPVLCTSEEW